MGDGPTPTMQETMADDRPRDRLGMTVLDAERCWELVRSEPLGRLATIVDGHPHLVPINHVVRGREVLFVSVPGTKLHRAMRDPGSRAAFEVDRYDPDTHTGWSVIVTGRLHPVQDLVEHTGLDLRGRPIWVDGYHDRTWLRLVPDDVQGRALGESS